MFGKEDLQLILHAYKLRLLNLIGTVGIVAGIFTSASLLPQLIKIIKEKQVEDLSVSMFVCLMAGLVLWIFYGVLREDWPIIITNSFSVFLNICILILRFRYSRNK